MSAFILQSLGGLLGRDFGFNDDSLQPADYKLTPTVPDASIPDEVDYLWPRSSFGMMNSATAAAPLNNAAPQYWEWGYWPAGCSRRVVITGIVQTSGGSPVSGATVVLFNTATNLPLDSFVSRSDGSYVLTDPYAAPCYAVAYHPGSPDTAGTTVDTLTGS